MKKLGTRQANVLSLLTENSNGAWSGARSGFVIGDRFTTFTVLESLAKLGLVTADYSTGDEYGVFTIASKNQDTMTDLTAAHEAAHEENAARTMAAWRNAVGRDANAAAHSDWLALPRFHFNAVIAYGGKIHRVWSPSSKFLDQPYCGASRWNGGRARVTDAEVTCLKCLRQEVA